MGPSNFFTCQLFVLCLVFWIVEGQFNNPSHMNQTLSNAETFDAVKLSRENKFLSDYMVSLWKGKSFVTFDSQQKIANPADRIIDYTRYSAARLGLNELPNVQKLIPEFGPVYNDILSFRYRGGEGGIYCSENGPDTGSLDLSLFIAFVSSEHGGYSARDMIQKQLKPQLKANRDELYRMDSALYDLENPHRPDNFSFYRVNYKFFYAKEFDKTEIVPSPDNDIVEIDMLNSKGNSSLRLAAVLNWVMNNCPEVKVVAVMDIGMEPIVINIKKLTAFVTSKEFIEDRVSGLAGNPYPFEASRKNKERLITYEQYPWNNYPNYPKKSSFIIKGRMVLPLMAAMQTTPMLLPNMDDVYFGICQLKAGYDFYKCGAFPQLQNCF